MSAVSVGIEELRADPGTRMLDMAMLVDARGADADEVIGAMCIQERTVLAPWQDVVTLAVDAALPIARAHRDRIDLLLVATESSLDNEKATSTWIHRFLGLPASCRNLELKHACYAGTGALRLAAAWIAAHPDPDAAALVVCTDQSRAVLGKPYEFVMGAGAVAVLVSRTPRIARIDPQSGVYAHEVPDLLRPAPRVEAGHSETSLLSYLDGSVQAFERYLAKLPESVQTLERLDMLLPHQLYHCPFGGITLRAHRSLRGLFGGRRDAEADWRRRVLPTLRFNRRMGGTYAGSVFVSLLGLLDQAGRPGERVGVYSYGSGSTAEFWSMRLGEGCRESEGPAALRAALDRRRALDLYTYEEFETAHAWRADQPTWTVDLPADPEPGRLMLVASRDWVREYRWSG